MEPRIAGEPVDEFRAIPAEGRDVITRKEQPLDQGLAEPFAAAAEDDVPGRGLFACLAHRTDHLGTGCRGCGLGDRAHLHSSTGPHQPCRLTFLPASERSIWGTASTNRGRSWADSFSRQASRIACLTCRRRILGRHELAGDHLADQRRGLAVDAHVGDPRDLLDDLLHAA